jgi:hypothetical protein
MSPYGGPGRNVTDVPTIYRTQGTEDRRRTFVENSKTGYNEARERLDADQGFFSAPFPVVQGTDKGQF